MDKIFLTLPKSYAAVNAETNERTRINPGTHEMECILDPFTKEGYWLVLKGTKIGARVIFWQQFSHQGVVITGQLPVLSQVFTTRDHWS